MSTVVSAPESLTTVLSLAVFAQGEQSTGPALAKVRDLSAKGCTLIGPAAFTPERKIKLTLTLPSAVRGVQEFDFIALCLWSKALKYRRQYVSSIAFIKLDPKYRQLIADLYKQNGLTLR